ncbi:MAG: DUF1207 domain-containing protein [Bacteroidota bacterium]
MKYLASIALPVMLLCDVVSAQVFEKIHFFPETTYVSPFAADAHAHRMEVENILLTKNVHASIGGAFPILNVFLVDRNVQASCGGSVHFELRPMGQAQIVSNDYYVDYLILDVPWSDELFVRLVSGHTSHHLSDNWYERLHLASAIRYSRDYLKLFCVYEKNIHQQFYLGADYAYIFTVGGQRINRPWTLQIGGKQQIAKWMESLLLYASVDIKIRQEAEFAATNTMQIGIAFPMQPGRVLRLALQYRKGLDERGQFFPQHRELSTIGFSIE